MLNEAVIKQIKEEAEANNIPIVSDSGLNYLLRYIQKYKVKKVLEIGSAVGYSAIMMCTVDPELVVTTIERDEKRYLEALKNIKKAGLEERIQLIFHDALEAKVDDQYDLIFIDAAKAQNQKFFERFEGNLTDEGTIITDNMNFHGLVSEDVDNIKSRNLKQLVRKVKDYILFLEENPKYQTEFLDVGDGLAVSKKRLEA